MSYLNTYTVKVLREIGDTMGLSFPVKARKADIVAKLVEVINGWHVIALDMEKANQANTEKSEPTYVILGGVTLTGAAALFMIRHEKHLNRYNPTLRMNRKGIVALTPRQRRRLDKKNRAYAAKIGL